MNIPNRIEFTFDGASLTALDGQSIAAALVAAGIREFRRTATDNPRGMFCGMGVCQDCLVEIDGEPNMLACAAKVRRGIKVRTQTAAPTPAAVRSAEMPLLESERPDVLVIGAGPGGLATAEAAARNGADVLLLDEKRTGGGQFYKQTDPALGQPALDRQQRDGTKMIAETSLSGARMITNATIWGAFEGPLLCAEVDGAPLEVRPKTVVVATGAYERPLMVPGWDLPGVMTTGAAQTLWRCYRAVPGRRIAIAGNGPLNFQVALELSRAGSDVAVIAEAAPPPYSRPTSVAKMLKSDPKLMWEGMKIVAALSARRIPIRYRASLEDIQSVDGTLSATITASAGRTERFEVDTVCMNYGFHPQNEILRLLGVRLEFDSARQQLVPSRTQHFETSVLGVFAIGDCCGTVGAPASVEEGRIAGAAAAARAAGCELKPPRKRKLARIRRFQKALWTLFSAPGQKFAEIHADALVCRCEEITKSRVAEAAKEDDFGIGSVKRTTRIGMGRCQGRYCMHAVAPHLAREQGVPLDDLAFFAPRPPVKPISISTIAISRMEAGSMESEL